MRLPFVTIACLLPSGDPSLQVLFLTGVGMTIGPAAALKFFIRPKNYKGSAFFLGGVVLVVWGWTFVGARACGQMGQRGWWAAGRRESAGWKLREAGGELGCVETPLLAEPEWQ